MPTLDKPDRELIGAADAAEILDVTRRDIPRLVAGDELRPTAKLGGRTGAYLFDRAEVERVKADRDARPAPRIGVQP